MSKLRAKRSTIALLAGTSLLAAPVAAACSSGPSYEEWAATDGAAGRINLDEVQNAFRESDSASDFEDRVNRIYEGDNIILIKVDQDGERTVLEGWEDLNKSKGIEDGSDDLLFSIVREAEQHEMRGHGANGYYRNSFGAGNFLFTYLLLSSLGPRYTYITQPTRYGSISRNRSTYRNSGSYQTQVSKNSRYFRNQRTFAGSRYDQAGRNISSSRQSYLGTQRSTGSFKTSGTGVRSSWGSSGRGSSFGRSSGGFRGGGGATHVIGFQRRSLRDAAAHTVTGLLESDEWARFNVDTRHAERTSRLAGNT